MKSSSPPSSSSSSSVSSTSDIQLLSSSSPPPRPPRPPRLSLRSPELQAEFLQECWNKFPSDRDVAESSAVASATSPPSPLPSPSSSSSSSSSSSPSCYDSRRARLSLSLSSPELLSELRQSRTRSLRRVPAQNGLTTVFCGRGRRGRGGEAPDSASSTPSANQKASH
ncbi:putative protein TPRXL [Sebastes umbrosus]|uniref:putative protein TPRXL n=1 Tax=Sebastes umbrosus TaxID=72105 RepID=UPI0018A00A37|nr:putative protein TPRXL [Sebastes umbrosus]XP_037614963.1 putative protein TPRXL [Sebastes umbrosus]